VEVIINGWMVWGKDDMATRKKNQLAVAVALENQA
jgi:hypothetical protein